MELLSKAFGIYETNCYILRTKMGEFIIDAGVDSAQWVCENVRKPLAILNTHGHFDHIWCNAELKKLLGVPIYCPKGDAFMLKSDCFDLGLTPCAADFEVEPNEIFRFGDIEVEFMHFAGHTPGCSMIKISESNSSLGMQFRTCENFGDFADSKSSLNPQNFHKYKSHTANTSIVIRDANQSASNLSLRGARSEASATKQSKQNRHTERSEVSKTRESNKNGESMIEKRIYESDSRDLDSSPTAQNDDEIYIFSGDFIFYRTIGRSDFPYSSPSDMKDSLQRFGKIPYNATLYPGHGQSTTIKDEQKNLPFYLRGLA